MGFYGKGSKREQWLTYRDKITYQNMVKAGPLYPLNSFMNQGIAQAIWGTANLPSNAAEFAHDVYSFFGIGTNLQELYISHGRMTEPMWDILAEGANALIILAQAVGMFLLIVLLMNAGNGTRTGRKDADT